MTRVESIRIKISDDKMKQLSLKDSTELNNAINSLLQIAMDKNIPYDYNRFVNYHEGGISDGEG